MSPTRRPKGTFVVPDPLVPLLRELTPDWPLPYPGNARNGDTDVIGRSVDLHGQYAPIVVQESTGYVLKGNHVHHALRERDWTHAAMAVLDVDDDEALTILLDDNATSDAGRYDDPALIALIERLGDDFTRTVITEQKYLDLLDSAERDANAVLDASRPSPGSAGGGLGSAVVSYTLVFDDEHQQSQWYAFLKWLRQSGVPGDTIGERLTEYLHGVVPEDVG